MLNFGMPVANPFVMSCRHLDRQYRTFLAPNVVTVAILAQGTPRGDAFYAALLLLTRAFDSRYCHFCIWFPAACYFS